MIARSTHVSEIRRDGALLARKQNSVGIVFLQMNSGLCTPILSERAESHGRGDAIGSRPAAASPARSDGHGGS